MRLKGFAVAIAVALAPSAGIAATAASYAPENSSHRCTGGFRHAIINGKHVCLKVGQRCNRRFDGQYHRYGFHCHTGRLTRRRPPPPPAPPPPRPTADLSVTLTDGPDPVAAGAPLTYTVRTTNAGPGPAPFVHVNVLIAPGLPFTIASFSGPGACIPTIMVTLVCGLPTLESGFSATVMLIVTPTAAGTLATTARVFTLAAVDPNETNDSATAVTTVTGAASVRERVLPVSALLERGRTSAASS
jgi:hypothetical protein